MSENGERAKLIARAIFDPPITVPPYSDMELFFADDLSFATVIIFNETGKPLRRMRYLRVGESCQYRAE